MSARQAFVRSSKQKKVQAQVPAVTAIEQIRCTTLIKLKYSQKQPRNMLRSTQQTSTCWKVPNRDLRMSYFCGEGLMSKQKKAGLSECQSPQLNYLTYSILIINILQLSMDKFGVLAFLKHLNAVGLLTQSAHLRLAHRLSQTLQDSALSYQLVTHFKGLRQGDWVQIVRRLKQSWLRRKGNRGGWGRVACQEALEQRKKIEDKSKIQRFMKIQKEIISRKQRNSCTLTTERKQIHSNVLLDNSLECWAQRTLRNHQFSRSSDSEAPLKQLLKGAKQMAQLLRPSKSMEKLIKLNFSQKEKPQDFKISVQKGCQSLNQKYKRLMRKGTEDQTLNLLESDDDEQKTVHKRVIRLKI